VNPATETDANPEPATVFIVDDDPAALDSLSAALGESGAAIETFPSAESFLAKVGPQRHGCAVLDLVMNPIDGLQLQQLMRQNDIHLPTIIVTAYPDVPSAVKTLSNGALTYIPKPCPTGELVAYVRKALAVDQKRRARQQRRAELSRCFSTLTPSERQVLGRLIDGQANKQIAADLQVGLRTVELRRSKLFQKTGARSLAELVRLKIELDMLMRQEQNGTSTPPLVDSS
jgi:two-component system response regulator FixJ